MVIWSLSALPILLCVFGLLAPSREGSKSRENPPRGFSRDEIGSFWVLDDGEDCRALAVVTARFKSDRWAEL